MVANLREMQENQWFSERWIDKPEFVYIMLEQKELLSLLILV